MKKIGIASDSTCDLPRELREKYDISILPLCVILGEKEYRDGVDITLPELFRWSDENNKTPKTSAIPPEEAHHFLKEKMQEYEQLIFFTISEELSSSGSVVQMTAEDLGVADRVHVIDSRNLCLGIGILVIEAAIMAQNGMPVEEIVQKVSDMRPLVRTSFVVDTLTYLHRGGRCSGMTALVGGTLKIHPCIEVEDGVMYVGKKYRGKIDKVAKNYLADRMEAIRNADPERIFIGHAAGDMETMEYARELIEGLNYFKEVYVCEVGDVIASHCGPGTFGTIFLEKN